MLRRMWKEFTSGNNIEAYLGIVTGIVVIFLDVIGVASRQVTESALLFLLSLLVFNEILDKWSFKEIKEILLNSQITTWSEVHTEVRAALRNAQSLKVLGVAPLRFVREYRKEILQICKHGKVHLCFVDPNSSAMAIIIEHRKEQLGDAVTLLEELKEIKSELGPNAHNLVIKTVNYIPPVIISEMSNDMDSIAFVTLNSIYQVGTRRITFVIRDSNRRWLAYYGEEFKAFWRTGQKVEFSS